MTNMLKHLIKAKWAFKQGDVTICRGLTQQLLPFIHPSGPETAHQSKIIVIQFSSNLKRAYPGHHLFQKIITQHWVFTTRGGYCVDTCLSVWVCVCICGHDNSRKIPLIDFKLCTML